MRSPHLVSAVFAAALAVACGGSSKPTSAPSTQPAMPATLAGADPKVQHEKCDKAMDHIFALDTTGDEQGKQVLGQLKGNRDEMMKQCEATATAKDFDCVMQTKTFKDLGKCEEPGN